MAATEWGVQLTVRPHDVPHHSCGGIGFDGVWLVVELGDPVAEVYEGGLEGGREGINIGGHGRVCCEGIQGDTR